jgi:hypothetical protein
MFFKGAFWRQPGWVQLNHIVDAKMDFSLTRLVEVRLTEFSFQLTPKWKLSLSPAHGPAHHSLETHFSLNMAAVSYLLFVWQNSDRCISFIINICLHSVFDFVSSTDYSTRYVLWIIFFPCFFYFFLFSPVCSTSGYFGISVYHF